MEQDRRQPGSNMAERPAGVGEQVLGELLDQAHITPPHLIAPLVAAQTARLGARRVSILLQDYGQDLLIPLPGKGLLVGEPEPIEASVAGTAFLRASCVEVAHPDGVRVYLPLLDGSDELGVMALTLASVHDDDRLLLNRIASLVADMLVTKSAYTDDLFRARRRKPMSLAAEMQWSLLPPLTLVVPQAAVAGSLEPAYDIAGDSFDYALNGDILHMAMIDAMGHGLDAATMATVAVGAYRHARRAGVSLSGQYAFMDEAVAEQFGDDHFVTAQIMRLNVTTGVLSCINAGHPAPLLIHDRHVVRQLESPTTLPAGLGGEDPVAIEHGLRHGDRVLCYTDGVIEERNADGEMFGEERLIGCVDRLASEEEEGVRTAVHRLSRTLNRERGGQTSDDATLLLFEWCGGTADHLIVPP